MIQNNELVRQYYFNLFTSSAEKIANGNNNHIFKWNIRDLQLSKNAEIGLVQVANNNLTITTERQYPPKAFNSFTEPISVSYLGQSVFKETITLTTDDITYGSGTYEIYSSSVYVGLSINKVLLFNYNLGDSAGTGWGNALYNTSTGLYTGTKYIIDGYYGDWIIIKLPNAIVLSKFIFWARPGLINRSPGLWKCYGSNDGINYEEIPEASNSITSLTQSSYVNNIYQKQTNNITKSYLYIGFVVRRLADIGATSDMLNFNEIRLYGREKILNNTIIIRALDTYQDGFDSQNRTAAIVYMGNDLRTIKNPTYHKLISRNLNSFSLNMTNSFEDSYNGIPNNIDLGLIFHIKDYGEQKEIEEYEMKERENTNNNLINIIE